MQNRLDAIAEKLNAFTPGLQKLAEASAVVDALNRALPHIVHRSELQSVVDKTGEIISQQNEAIAKLFLQLDTLTKQVAALTAHATLSGFDPNAGEGRPN
jgi:uncharacterized coiled-coil protein SlyX